MAQIKLSQGKIALVDDIDFERLNRWKWCARKCQFKNRTVWYAMRTDYINGKLQQRTVYLHKEVAKTMGLKEVDHRDGDGLNNQRQNLRPVTRQQNMHNGFKRSGCSSMFKGVSWDKESEKWRASIRVNKKLRHLGFFADERDAAGVYNKAAIQFFGEFARPNSV